MQHLIVLTLRDQWSAVNGIYPRNQRNLSLTKTATLPEVVFSDSSFPRQVFYKWVRLTQGSESSMMCGTWCWRGLNHSNVQCIVFIVCVFLCARWTAGLWGCCSTPWCTAACHLMVRATARSQSKSDRAATADPTPPQVNLHCPMRLLFVLSYIHSANLHCFGRCGCYK